MYNYELVVVTRGFVRYIDIPYEYLLGWNLEIRLDYVNTYSLDPAHSLTII